MEEVEMFTSGWQKLRILHLATDLFETESDGLTGVVIICSALTWCKMTAFSL